MQIAKKSRQNCNNEDSKSQRVDDGRGRSLAGDVGGNSQVMACGVVVVVVVDRETGNIYKAKYYGNIYP